MYINTEIVIDVYVSVCKYGNMSLHFFPTPVCWSPYKHWHPAGSEQPRAQILVFKLSAKGNRLPEEMANYRVR